MLFETQVDGLVRIAAQLPDSRTVESCSFYVTSLGNDQLYDMQSFTEAFTRRTEGPAVGDFGGEMTPVGPNTSQVSVPKLHLDRRSSVLVLGKGDRQVQKDPLVYIDVKCPKDTFKVFEGLGIG